MRRSCESDIHLLHLNTNKGIRGVRENMRDSVFGYLSFFTEPSHEAIMARSDIATTIRPFIAMGGDAIGFSEVYGPEQLETTIDLLESKGYRTHHSPAFKLWSQPESPRSQVYNVIGFRGKPGMPADGNSILQTQVSKKRPLEGKLISLLYLLRRTPNDTGGKPKLERARSVYRALTDGILDGAITSYTLDEDLRLSYLHVHSDNPDLSSFFTNHLTSSPHVLFGDFNIRDIRAFIRRPPFSGKGYRSLVPPGVITYPFSVGFRNISPIFINNADNILGNRRIESAGASSVRSCSDHEGLSCRIRVKS